MISYNKPQLYYKRRGKLNKKGEAAIEIGVYFSREKRVWFSTHKYIKEDQWDEEKKQVKKHTHKVEYNALLNRYCRDIEEIQLKAQTNERECTPEEIKAYFKGSTTNKIITLNDFYLDRITNDKSIKWKNFTDKRQTLNILNEFNPKIYFDKISFSLATEFQNFLIKKGFGENTIYKHRKNLVRMLNLAVSFKYLDHGNYFDFKNLKIKRKESDRVNLSDKQIENIEKLDFDNSTPLGISRNCFLFACYTGLRFSDIQGLTRNDFDETEKGLELVKVMQKVKRPVRIPLHTIFNGKPEKFIRDILPESNEEKIFPGIHNATVNKYLKIIQSEAKIKNSLTFHLSRHTFLTKIAEKTGNVFTVMQYGGISKIETAQIYIHISKESTDKGLENVKW